MEEYDVNPVLDLFALVRSNKIDFDIAENPGWFPFNFEDSIVYSTIFGRLRIRGALLLGFVLFLRVIKTSGVTLEWVLLSLKRH